MLSSLAVARLLTTRPASRSSTEPIPSTAVASADRRASPPLAVPSAATERVSVNATAQVSAPERAALPPSAKLRAAYPQNVANRAVPRLGDKPWLISEEWRARHERQLRSPARKSAQLVFLGDSITEGWGAVTAFRQHFGRYAPLNLGIAGDMTQNVLWRIEHGALEGLTAKVVVLLIGVNNLGGGFPPEETADGVRATIAAVRERLPGARVVLLGILPARRELEHPLRQRILETNRLLESLVEPEHVEYHDIGAVLLEVDGRISPLMTRDFLHPTAEGFERLSTALDPLLAPLFEPELAPQAESRDSQ